MAEKTKLVEAHLVRIEFSDKGTSSALRKTTAHTLTSVLHWPRYTYQQRIVARKVEVDGAARSYAPEDWIDAVLFKESLQLPSAVTFRVSVPLAADAVAKALAATAKAAAVALGDVVEAAAPTKAVGKVAAAPLDAIGAILAGVEPDTLGEGSLLFDEELLARGGERTIELRAPATVEKRIAAAGKSPARTKTIRRRGDPVARLVVAFSPL